MSPLPRRNASARRASAVPNPRPSIAKVALATLANRIDDFEEFADQYWNECARGVYYIPVHKEDFGFSKKEYDQAQAGKFYAACSPALAMKLRREDADAPYIAEIRTIDVPHDKIRPVKKGIRGAVAIDRLTQVEILRVMDRDKAMRAWRWQNSVLPSSKSSLYEFWEKAREKESGKKRKKRQAEEAKAARAERKKKRKMKENPSSPSTRSIPFHINSPKC